MKSNTEQLKIAKEYLGDGCRKCCSMANNCCCSFVCKIFKEAGNSSLFFGGKTVTYCPTAIQWCKANLAQIPIYLALPSDVIFFDWELNGTPNHIGFVRERISDQEISTLEGNTTANFVVACRTRTVKYVQGVFRPHFKATFNISKPLTIDGCFGYNSIAMLQKALGMKTVDGILGKDTVKKLQKKVGVTQDGSWGEKTSKAVQKKLCGFKGKDVDGAFGVKSAKALQQWCNDTVFPKKTTTTTKPTTTTTTAPTTKPTTTTETKKPATTTGTKKTAVKLPSLRVKRTASEVMKGAVGWGKAIAKDNSFHYGHGDAAHHNGCYFCGTQPSVKKKSGMLDWKKTYCCNPFVHACFAHGGLVPQMLKLCEQGKSYGFKKTEGYAKSSLFKKVSKAQEGDVLCSDSHVALDVGGNKVVEAAHSDDNKRNSASWNSSIGIESWTGWTRAYRFIGKVDADIDIMFGEWSDRVLLIQKFLNYYFKKDVVAEDKLFGDYTLKYVKKYQEKKGLTADGIIGKKTLDAMKKDI